MKTYVVTLSQVFPAIHPRHGEPTGFEHKVIAAVSGWGGTDFEVVGNIFDTPELVTKVRPKLFN